MRLSHKAAGTVWKARLAFRSDGPRGYPAHAQGEPDQSRPEKEEGGLLPWPGLRGGDADHDRQEHEEQNELERKAEESGDRSSVCVQRLRNPARVPLCRQGRLRVLAG
jgi:hypothetical protein